MRRLDDLQLNGLKIIQDTAQFCFGTDAVLLSDFSASCKGLNLNSKIVDLGCGNGIIPLLLSAKTPAQNITGIEIQQEVAKLAQENVEMNLLTEKITIICDDLKNPHLLEASSIDLITCNPPYKEAGGAIKNPESALAIARHEVKCTLEDIIITARRLLKFRGKLCMVYQPDRLVELFEIMRKHFLEPKRLQMVHFSAKKAPILVLIEAVNGGKPKLFCQPPIFINNK